MTGQRQALFWLALLAVFGLALWLLSSILLPFVLGMAIGYFLDPLVGAIERRGVARAWASGAIIVAFFALGGLLMLLVVPAVVEQSSSLAKHLPALLAALEERLEPLLELPILDVITRGAGGAGGAPAGGIAPPMAEVASKIAQIAGSLLGGLLSGGLAVVNLLALLGVTPLVAFYLLRDWPRVIAEVDGWLPREHAETIREQARRIDAVLAGFARGAATVCLALGAFYALALSLVGLDFGLIIGLSAGAVSFVPYLGVIFGLVSSVGVALYQFWPDWIPVAVVLGIFLVGQILSDYVLTPRLVGERVGLHPLWVIFGVLAGGALFGFVGVLLAVPACAVIGVLVRFAIGRYRTSPLYLGDDD